MLDLLRQVTMRHCVVPLQTVSRSALARPHRLRAISKASRSFVTTSSRAVSWSGLSFGGFGTGDPARSSTAIEGSPRPLDHSAASDQSSAAVGPSDPARQAASSAKSSFSTVNADEISHFSRLSSQWWSETGEFALLHRMNPTRVEYIRQKVALDPHSDREPEWTFEGRHTDRERESRRGTGRWLEGYRCLDVGCGGGLLSESLARLGGDVVGVDASKENIGIARTHAAQDPMLPFVDTENGIDRRRGATSKGAPPGSLKFRCTTAETLRDQGEKFDVVCAMEVLEHVDEPGEFMKCLGEMVKPGGHLIMSTISRTPLSQLLTLTLAEDVLRLVTPGTHTYKKFVLPEELKRFVHREMGGLNVWCPQHDGDDVHFREFVGETRGIVYDPLRSQWRLWGGASGTWAKELGEKCNYMYHAKKRTEAEMSSRQSAE